MSKKGYVCVFTRGKKGSGDEYTSLFSVNIKNFYLRGVYICQINLIGFMNIAYHTRKRRPKKKKRRKMGQVDSVLRNHYFFDNKLHVVLVIYRYDICLMF